MKLKSRKISLFIILTITLISFCNLPAKGLDLSIFKVKGFEGKGPLEFINPEDVILTSDGRIIVADQKNNRIQVLTKDGDFIRFIPPAASKNQPQQLTPAEIEKLKQFKKILQRPTGLALDKSGNLYISCQNTHQIAIIDFESGELKGTLGKWGKGQEQLNSPMDISINSDGLLAIAEWRNKRVQIIDTTTGKCVKELIYQKESKRGRYSAVKPRGVHWLPNGNLVVTYPLYHQVVCWNPFEGQVLWRYGAKGRDRGMLNNPSYIADGLEGKILISDTLNNRIVEITPDGMYSLNLPIRKGSAPGRLISPRGLALNNEESLIVCDQGNNRIHFFQPGQATLMLRQIKELALSDKWDEAIPKIERVLYLQPNNIEAREMMVNALYFFGDKHFKNQEYIKAEEFFRRVLRYRPEDPVIPQKLDAIFWASNQGLIANIVFGIIAIIVILILLWIFKVIISRFILNKS